MGCYMTAPCILIHAGNGMCDRTKVWMRQEGNQGIPKVLFTLLDHVVIYEYAHFDAN